MKKAIEGISPSSEGVSRSDGVVSFKNLPYNPKLKLRARKLRKAGNIYEIKLWLKLKNKQIDGSDFYRQKIIGNYIVDFYCFSKKLIIELDGSSHNEKVEYDKERDSYLQSFGLKVLHFKNEDIVNNLDLVLEQIRNS